MSVFKDITFEFKGETYTVKADNVYRLLADLYDCVHPSDVLSEKPNLPKLANAFALCVNYCGGKTTGEEIYASMFSGESNLNTPEVVGALMLLIVPPSEYQTGGNVDSKKKTQETQ